jgi:type VI secretion system protein ImpK
MTSRSDPGLDEPTVIARRPLGPNRSAASRKQPGPGQGGAWRAIEPPVHDPAFDDLVARLPESKDGTQPSHGVPVPEEPKNDEDKLCAAATPLFVLVAHLKGAVEQADVEALRKEIVDQLRRFEERAVRFGATGNDVSAARYALCSLIDETVMTTPWGSSSAWSTNSLLLEFHSETWGGEKFFAILDRTKADPQRHLALFKLLDLCLLLGFEGKYRVIDNGRDQLNDLRLDLARLLRQFGKTPPQELSPSWRGIVRRRSLQRFIPLWVVFSVAAVLIISSYGFVKWRVWNETAPALQSLSGIAKTSN